MAQVAASALARKVAAEPPAMSQPTGSKINEKVPSPPKTTKSAQRAQPRPDRIRRLSVSRSA
jgi:hypothetical protein